MSKVLIQTIFSEVLDLQTDVDWPEVRYQVTEGWDSLAHMAIVAELEDQFQIMLDTDDVLDMSSFLKALEIVSKYGVSVE